MGMLSWEWQFKRKHFRLKTSNISKNGWWAKAGNGSGSKKGSFLLGSSYLGYVVNNHGDRNSTKDRVAGPLPFMACLWLTNVGDPISCHQKKNRYLKWRLSWFLVLKANLRGFYRWGFLHFRYLPKMFGEFLRHCFQLQLSDVGKIFSSIHMSWNRCGLIFPLVVSVDSMKVEMLVPTRKIAVMIRSISPHEITRKSLWHSVVLVGG